MFSKAKRWAFIFNLVMKNTFLFSGVCWWHVLRIYAFLTSSVFFLYLTLTVMILASLVFVVIAVSTGNDRYHWLPLIDPVPNSAVFLYQQKAEVYLHLWWAVFVQFILFTDHTAPPIYMPPLLPVLVIFLVPRKELYCLLQFLLLMKAVSWPFLAFAVSVSVNCLWNHLLLS